MICPKCIENDHVNCQTPDCTCGHAGTSVRPLTDLERQDVRAGRLNTNVMPRETEGPQ